MCARFSTAKMPYVESVHALSQEYRTLRAVTVHHAHEGLLRSDSVLGAAVQDLTALRLTSKVALVRDTSAAAPRLLRGQGPRITLRLHNSANPSSRARELTLYSPYWLVNKADQTLRTRDASLAASLPTHAPAPASGASAQPVLLSAPRGLVRLAVHPGFWSRSVNLDALGLHSSMHVLGPAHPTGPGAVCTNAAASAAAAATPHVRWSEVEQPIASRGAPARRRKQGNRAVRPASASPAGGPEARAGAKTRAEGMNFRKPEASPGSAEHVDRGHVAWRRGSIASATALTSAELDSAKSARERQRLRRYDFAVEVVLGPSAFHRTKACPNLSLRWRCQLAIPADTAVYQGIVHAVVNIPCHVLPTTTHRTFLMPQVATVSARYVMHNASDEPLQYGQRGSRIVWQLAPAASTPFHWFARPHSGCAMRQLVVI